MLFTMAYQVFWYGRSIFKYLKTDYLCPKIDNRDSMSYSCFINEISFRDKSKGWNNYGIFICYQKDSCLNSDISFFTKMN